MHQKSKKKKQPKSFISIIKSTDFRKILAVVFVTALAVTGYFYFFPDMPDLPEPSMKDLSASHNVELGMLANPKRIDDSPYGDILISQYSFITSDGELHWNRFRPSPTEYNYSELDQLVSFGNEHNMPIQGHHLVWNEEDSLPDWLKNGNYSREELLNIMHSHIITTVGHYKGKVKEWTVVNEAFSREKRMYGLKDWWGDNLGSSTAYIDDAFKWAHEADPEAKLILNDFYNETQTDVSDAMYNYLKGAKDRGVPIDGIGMQMHIDATQPPTKENIIKNMQRFAALGYPVYVTEFNVHAENVTGSKAYKSQLEAQITYDVTRACVESKSCVSFTVFGQTDKSGFIQWIRRHKTPSHLFTTRYEPKQSYYAFYRAWSQP